MCIMMSVLKMIEMNLFRWSPCKIFMGTSNPIYVWERIFLIRTVEKHFFIRHALILIFFISHTAKLRDFNTQIRGQNTFFSSANSLFLLLFTPGGERTFFPRRESNFRKIKSSCIAICWLKSLSIAVNER